MTGSPQSARAVELALVTRPDGRLLVARRAAGPHLASVWEFPGGKVAPGETGRAAMVRELWEETGLVARRAQALARWHWRYEDPTGAAAPIWLRLRAWRVTAWSGQLQRRDSYGRSARWLSVKEIASLPVPPANRGLLKNLTLPGAYPITGPWQGDQSDYLQRLEALFRAGASLVLLRIPELAGTVYRRVATAALGIARRHQARLLLHGDDATLQGLPGAGRHLTARQLLRVGSRRPPGLLAASCHNRHELQAAAALGCDLVTLSPVAATPSHPGGRLLGWRGFAALVAEIDQAGRGLPTIYALGGMALSDLPRVRALGGWGVALRSSCWRSPPDWGALDRYN